MSNLHFRANGVSHDLDMETLSLNSSSSDAEVKAAVARYLDEDVSKVENLAVVREAGGQITLRAQAVFGSPPRLN